MTSLLAIAGCALLFAVYGLLRRGRGAGCGSCETACPSKETKSHGRP
jgi:hypothetical protein